MIKKRCDWGSDSSIPGKQWARRTGRASAWAGARACAGRDPPCWCTTPRAPAGLPSAAPNTATLPCLLSLSLSPSPFLWPCFSLSYQTLSTIKPSRLPLVLSSSSTSWRSTWLQRGEIQRWRAIDWNPRVLQTRERRRRRRRSPRHTPRLGFIIVWCFYDHVNSAGLQLLYTPLQCSSGTCPRSHLLFLHAELLRVKINSRMTGSELWDASNFVIQRKLGHVQEMFQAMKWISRNF